jgi:lysophospholipase L1-like esterase
MRHVAVIAAFALLAALPAAAADLPLQTRCKTPSKLLDLGHPLPRVAARLARGETVTVVAIGSSSTGGAGASTENHSYPSQLRALWPQLVGGSVVIHNHGINGQDIIEMNARLRADAIDIRPDLVLWQLGTNAVLRSQGVEVYRAHIRQGVAALKAVGIDVVLIDLQYAPKVLQDPDYPAMQNILAEVAAEQGTGLYRRFAAMRHWLRSGNLQPGDLVSPDGLHMNDLGYACWAHSLALALHRTVTGPEQKSAVSGKN